MSDAVLPLVTPATVFDFLPGEWALSRSVSGLAEMRGTASIQATSGETEYRERVEVRTSAGAVFAASARYVLRRTRDGVAFYFADGESLFQALCFKEDDRGRLRAEAEHGCGEDRYVSTYELGPELRFSVRHDVRGPRKQYVSVTEFHAIDRISGSAGRISDRSG